MPSLEMKKIRLNGIANSENFNYYIFEKTENLLESLSKVFKEVLGVDFILSYEQQDNNGNWKIKTTNVFKEKDSHDAVSRSIGKPRIDIFYGDKKVFLTIVCSNKERLKFNEELEKIAEMPNLKNENKKRS